MQIKHPFLSTMALAAALAAPAGILMVSSLQAQAVQVKIYDRDHKDYHVWDDNEDKAYRGYLSDQHQTYRPYAKMKKSDQSKYWAYRHDHPDVHK